MLIQVSTVQYSIVYDDLTMYSSAYHKILVHFLIHIYIHALINNFKLILIKIGKFLK